MRLERDYSVDYDRTLGTGASGAVYLAHRHGSNDRFAVKKFNLREMNMKSKALLRNEVDIFLSMDHPGVARLTDVYESENQLSLVMECVDGGELFDRVKNQHGLAENAAADATLQILLMISYMHARGLVHRDLKLENLLCDRENGDVLKLIDFGFSAHWKKGDRYMNEHLGTSYYVAPEIFTGKYTSQCDLWSVGVIAFMMLSGCRPFRDGYAAKRGEYIKKHERWSKVSEMGWDFVKQLLVVNPADRLTAEQALQHPWLEKAHALRQCRQNERFDESIVSSLSEFAKASPPKRMVFELMAWSLSSGERAAVSEAFLALDKSNTGVIRSGDLLATLNEQYDVPLDDCHAIFEALDSNNNGYVDYSKFLAAMMASRLHFHEKLLMLTVERYDAERNDIFTLEELVQLIGSAAGTDARCNIAGKIVHVETVEPCVGANPGAKAAADTCAEVARPMVAPKIKPPPMLECYNGLRRLQKLLTRLLPAVRDIAYTV
jgi:calcium-dependent protein kinase